MEIEKIPQMYDIQNLQFEIPFKCKKCGNEENHIIPVFSYLGWGEKRWATLYKDEMYVKDECENCDYKERYEIRAIDCEENRLLIDKLNAVAKQIETMRNVKKIFDIKKFGGVK